MVRECPLGLCAAMGFLAPVPALAFASVSAPVSPLEEATVAAAPEGQDFQ